MAALSTYLTKIFEAAFISQGLPAELGSVTTSERPDLSQFQVNGALAGAKRQGVPPRELAERIIEQLGDKELFAKIEIAGPGFINLTLTDQFLTDFLRANLADPRLGQPLVENPERVIIDFSGANVAKSLHIGHLRSNTLGDSLQRLYRFLGHEVHSDTHLGDWGTPMGMLIAQLSQERPELEYFNPDFQGEYPVQSPVSMADLERLYPLAASRFKNEPDFRLAAQQATVELQSGRTGYLALWRQFVRVSVQAIRQTLEQLDIHLDWWYGESRYQERIAPILEQLKQNGGAILSDGAWIIPLGSGLPPFILQKSDGGYLYSTTDLATLDERIRDNQAERIIYVVDQRQSLHFRQLFLAARQIGLAPERVKLLHIDFGTINGPDGRPLKTRDGTLIKLQRVIDQTTTLAGKRMEEAGLAKEYPAEEQNRIAQLVARAALKFADLSANFASDYNFDLEKFTSFEGKTGPYLLYTAVRIKSIGRKVGRSGSGQLLPPGEWERPLYLALAQFPASLTEAWRQHQPNLLCEYAYDLAQKFNRFYQECNILRENDPVRQDSWLSLSEGCLRVLEQTLDLLGIEVPERM